MRFIALALVLLWSSAAGAVPRTINFTGRLTTSAGPVNGAVNVTLSLYADASGGPPLWSENHTNVGADNGLVFMDIGTQTPLDDDVLDGRRLFLEIVVGDETLAPRLALNSVPYAVRTDTAASADRLGSLTPDDVVTSVTAGTGVTLLRSGNAVNVSLTTTGCGDGQIFKFNMSTNSFSCRDDAVGNFTAGNGLAISGGSISLKACTGNQIYKMNGSGTFTCQADDNTIYSGTLPVKVTGTTISLSATAAAGCGSGAVLKSDGTTFTCQADATGTPLTAGNGIAIASSVVSLSTSNCQNGQVYKFSTMSGSFTCQNDAGVTAATAPLVVTGGTTVSLPTTCGPNQVLRWNGSNWLCSPTFTVFSCTWAVVTLTSANDVARASCGPPGTTKHPISGGCLASSGSVTLSAPDPEPRVGDSPTTSTGWACGFTANVSGHSAYALCCDTN